MNKEEFVEVIKRVVVGAVNRGMKQLLEKPPGRQPRQKDLEMSAFYNSLSEHDKNKVDSIVQDAVDFSIFQFLCVLDGVVAIENEDKGELKLFYEKDTTRILLNDPNEDYLHDIFNAE